MFFHEFARMSGAAEGSGKWFTSVYFDLDSGWGKGYRVLSLTVGVL
jgi:hypothetical protein